LNGLYKYDKKMGQYLIHGFWAPDYDFVSRSPLCIDLCSINQLKLKDSNYLI